MNGRIKEMIDHHERINNLYIIGPVQRAEVEDFVEAIIKECVNLFDKDEKSELGYRIGDTIYKHFGIK